MTNERRQDVLLIALIVSILAHIGLMIYAKPKVMTHIAAGFSRLTNKVPMRVTEATEKPAPIRAEALPDRAAEREAPQAEKEVLAPPEAEIAKSVDVFNAVAPALDETAVAETAEETPVFSTEPIKLDDTVSQKIPRLAIETPEFDAAATFEEMKPSGEARDNTLPAANGPQISSAGTALDSLFLPEATEKAVMIVPPEEKIEPKMSEEKQEKFIPPTEVLEKVDERLVEQEKAAVRELVNAADANELKPFANISVVTAQQGGWTYFKTYISPRTKLPIIPKDVVVLFDASGSIGKDRMASIRHAAKKVLRSATNSDDRFNFVAFRDRFSYAFTSWRPCDQPSFEAADKWLNRVAAHGRTDVFGTIASVLTLPRDPKRPIIALVITDGEANAGVSDTKEILSKFTALNDGLISVYMYGVKKNANCVLIDTLTHGNRGESFIYDGWFFRAGEGLEALSERFRDPVLSDLRVVFAAGCRAEVYPAALKNLYRGGMVELYGRVPAGCKEISFSLRGLNGNDAYEGYFTFPIATAAKDAKIVEEFNKEYNINQGLTKEIK